MVKATLPRTQTAMVFILIEITVGKGGPLVDLVHLLNPLLTKTKWRPQEAKFFHNGQEVECHIARLQLDFQKLSTASNDRLDSIEHLLQAPGFGFQPTPQHAAAAADGRQDAFTAHNLRDTDRSCPRMKDGGRNALAKPKHGPDSSPSSTSPYGSRESSSTSTSPSRQGSRRKVKDSSSKKRETL